MVKFKYNNKIHKINSLSTEDHIYKIIKNSGNFYEIKLLEKIKSLNLNGVYIDIGANIGNHSIFFAHHCNSSKVISIEICKEIYDILINNLKNNPSEKYKSFNCGIGNIEEYVSLTQINKTNLGMTKINGKGKILIDRLDKLLKNVDNISLIKIDIEGYEYKAIQGSKRIINKYHPIIICEAHAENEFNKINNLLNSFGYITNKINLAITPTYIWE